MTYSLCLLPFFLAFRWWSEHLTESQWILGPLRAPSVPIRFIMMMIHSGWWHFLKRSDAWIKGCDADLDAKCIWVIIIIIITRPYAALRAAGLHWTVRLYCSLGWVYFERKYTFWECILKGNIFFESALKPADCFLVWKYFSSYLISLDFVDIVSRFLCMRIYFAGTCNS